MYSSKTFKLDRATNTYEDKDRLFRVVISNEYSSVPKCEVVGLAGNLTVMHTRISEALTDSFNAASLGFGYTFSVTIPAKRIDFIDADQMLKPQSYQAIAGGPSDHCMVIVELEPSYSKQ